ncbi:DUF6266 family protein [Pedobacter sp. MC2016-14]|uniref:DUF6266 family protein n=1 Tax=Pedobacter sp. MC2016-14 TaxID=2897327 RepID=UPI001E45A816|nr:DUF6266 family protein [Pedobacter sp. MC2016-14]MCD0487925.1 DUF6266 family protein [Pedobacter sp. MC2016-14]
MAKAKNGIFGAISGKIGPFVGGVWKGIPYIRMAPQKPETPKPRSPAQLANEEKFKFANHWMVPFHPFITVGFANLAIRQTEISAALSVNYKAITGVFPDLIVDYSKVMISKGDLPVLVDATVELIAEDAIKLSWPQNDHKDARFDDQLILAIYCPKLGITDGFTGGIKRSAKECVFKFNENMVGLTLQIYVGLTSLNRKEISDSLHVGTLLP